MAAGFADHLALPLNRFVTVDWESAECVGRMQDIQGRFLERMGKWLRYRNVTRAYLWVIENERVKGLHSHILVHVPSEYLSDFNRNVPAWVDGDIDQSTVDVRRTRYWEGPSRLSGIKGRLRYILKGGDADVSVLHNVNQMHQGTVVGKRCGTSQSLGAKSRQLQTKREN